MSHQNRPRGHKVLNIRFSKEYCFENEKEADKLIAQQKRDLLRMWRQEEPGHYYSIIQEFKSNGRTEHFLAIDGEKSHLAFAKWPVY